MQQHHDDNKQRCQRRNTHSSACVIQTTAKTKPSQPLYNNMTLPITYSTQNLAFSNAQTQSTSINDDDHEAFLCSMTQFPVTLSFINTSPMHKTIRPLQWSMSLQQVAKHSSQHGNLSMDKFGYVSNLIILSTPFATTCLFSPILVSLPTKLLFSPIISCLLPTTHETSHTICVRRFSQLDPLTQILCKFTQKRGIFHRFSSKKHGIPCILQNIGVPQTEIPSIFTPKFRAPTNRPFLM